MKKIIIVVTLALSLLFSVGFVSCENNDQTNSSVTSTTSDSLNNNGSSSSKNSEEVEQAKNEKQNLLSEYYVQNTKELTAEQKLTAEISYNFVLQQLNNFRGTVDELNAKYNEIYLKLQESVNLIKSTASTLAEIKDKAKKELELIYNSVLAYANNSQAQLSALYDSVLEQIENATEDSKSQITNAVTEFKSYIYEYVKNVITLTTEDIKTLANNALNVLEKKALKQLENYEDLKNNIITFYEEQKEKINSYNEQEIKELISDTISSVKGKLEEVIKEKINEFKQEVILKINILYNSTIDKISDEEIKAELEKLRNDTQISLDKVTDLDSAKTSFDEISSSFNTATTNIIAKALNKLKSETLKKLDDLYNPLSAKISDETIKTELDNAYSQAKVSLNNIEDLDSAKQSAEEIYTTFSETAKSVITKILNNLKTSAINSLDKFYTPASNLISDNEIKNRLYEAYNNSKNSLNNVTDLDTAKTAMQEIVDEFTTVGKKIFVLFLQKLKNEAINKVNDFYGTVSGEISDEEIKNELDKAYNISLTNLNSVTDLDSAQTALKSIVDNFTTATKNIINKVLNKFIEKYKGELKVIYDNISKPLSTDVKTELEKLYNNAVSGFENAKTKKDLINVLNTFKDDAKTYVVESLNEIFIKMGSKPDVWAYLPTTFKPENRIVATSTLPTYEDLTDISTIPTNYIGKQLNVVYTVFNKTDVALNYVNKVYDVLNKVEEMYNSIFENSDGKNIVLNAGEFNLTLILTQTKYEISTKISGVELYVYSNLTTNDFGARIQLSESNIIKYNVTDSSIKMAYSILNSSICQVTLEKDSSNNVVGYIYETLGLGETEIKSTSAYLTVKDGYTTVVGNKGDFIPTSGGINCEVYENSTGNYVGSEVSETFKSNQYDTLWYNLKDIGGITTIKKIDEANGVNPDTIYINGSTESIHSMWVSLTNPSRRFDIEFKTVYAFTYNAETEEYEIVEFEVPMMFIQESQEETFATDFENKNTKSVETDSISIKSTDEAKNAIKYGYHTLVENYKEIKDSVSYQSIIDYCNE